MERMSWAEIRKKYPNQRVAISDIVWLNGEIGGTVESGIVRRSEQEGYSRMDIRSFAVRSKDDTICKSTGNGSIALVGMMEKGPLYDPPRR